MTAGAGAVVALLFGLSAAGFGVPADANELPTQIAGVANAFAPSKVTIDRGEALVFTNADPLAAHNVASVASSRTGALLFGSETVDFGVTARVERVGDLEPGVYDFVCTLHPKMTGSLTVEDR